MKLHRDYALWPQIHASFAMSMSGMSTGTFHAFSSVIIPMIQKPEKEGGWNISLEQGSWIASLFFIGTIFGSIGGGAVTQKFGAKRIALCLAPCIFAAWMLAAFAQDINYIYSARILLGIFYGFFLALVKVYNAEISHPDIRGATSSFYSVLLSLGLLYGFILGYLFTDWRLITCLLSVPALVFFGLTLTIPNSPYWLIEHGRSDEAKEALQWLRGDKFDITEEFNEILEKKAAKNCDQQRTGFFMMILWQVFSMGFFTAFIKIAFLMALTEWAGMNVLNQYLVIIFQESGSSIDPELAPIFVAGVRVILAMFSMIVLRYSPRKTLLLICSGAIGISYIVLGIYNYCKSVLEPHDPGLRDFLDSWGWIPLPCLILIQAAQTVGFLSVLHFNLQAESFPTEIRSIACGMCGVVTAVSRFITSKLFPQFIQAFQFYGMFWFFSSVIVVIIVYVHFLIPENTGQSLVETEDKLKRETSKSET